MAQHRNGHRNPGGKVVEPETEIEDDTLFVAFYGWDDGSLIVLDADSITGFHQTMEADFIFSMVNTAFHSYRVTASLPEIIAALGITPLAIGTPPHRSSSESDSDAEQEEPKPDVGTHLDNRKRYAFSNEPLPPGHPSAEPKTNGGT